MSDELFEAIESHDASRVAKALSGGLDPNVPLTKPPYWTALEAAIEEVFHDGPADVTLEIVKLLVKNGANVNAWDSKRHLNPLLAAVYWHNRDVVSLLLEAGSDPNAVNCFNETALSLAVEDDECEIARMLLERDATMIDRSGGVGAITPLGRAAQNLSLTMIRLLLSFGANIHATDADGRLPHNYLPPRDPSNAEVRDEALKLLSIEATMNPLHPQPPSGASSPADGDA